MGEASSVGARPKVTHKPPQGIDAGLRESLQAIRELLSKGSPYAIHRSDGQNLEFHELITIGNIFERAEAALLAAPPDPRKDLAARLANVPTLVAGDFLADGFVTPAMQKYVATLVQKRLDEALAEMRGAKR